MDEPDAAEVARAKEFSEKSLRVWQHIEGEFSPEDALIFLHGATAQAIMRATKSKDQALATSYRFFRNLQKTVQRELKDGTRKT